MSGRAVGPQFWWVRLSLRILLYQVFYNFLVTESILQLIWRQRLSISDLLAQIEGKNRLRNGTLILQLVKMGMAPAKDMLGQFKPKMPSKGNSNQDSMKVRWNRWSVLKRSTVCVREEFPTYRYLKWGQGWAGVDCLKILREDLRLGSVFGGPQMVRPSWEGNLGSI